MKKNVDEIAESLRIFKKVRAAAHRRVADLGNSHGQFGTLLAGIVREEFRLAREISDAMEAIHRFGAIANDLASARVKKPRRAAGGIAAAKKLDSLERSQRARHAAVSRWSK